MTGGSPWPVAFGVLLAEPLHCDMMGPGTNILSNTEGTTLKAILTLMFRPTLAVSLQK